MKIVLRKLSLLAAVAAVVALGLVGGASAKSQPSPGGYAWGLYGFADGR